jgi:hypothetical protein
MRPAIDPAGHWVPRTKPTCLLHTWRPPRRRPFVLVLHLHQHQSSRNLHLQYLAKNQSTQRCQSLITQRRDHPPVLEPHMVLMFARRPRHQRRSQKLASPRSGLPIQPTPGKIRIRKTMKSQRRRRGEPKAEIGSVTQVPENSLHCLPMRSPRRCLKTSTQTYRELDVRPRRR